MKSIMPSIDYDDILLLPTLSEVNSRNDVNVKSDFKTVINNRNIYPILSAPMKEISGVELVSALSDNNCLGILHRFQSYEKTKEDIEYLSKNGKDFGIAVGIQDIGLSYYAQQMGASLLCVDIANGYISRLGEFITYLRKIGITIPIITGNVVTADGYKFLVNSGADFVRVGIGSGTLCSTRDNIGVGCPQLTALDSCYHATTDGFIISDGGVINPGRAVKSFVFGANYVMVGSLLAHANETENKDGHFYGMASRRLQQDVYGAVKSVEGLEMYIPLTEKYPCSTIISEFITGIQSACTYLNCADYRELRHVKNLVYTGKGTLK